MALKRLQSLVLRALATTGERATGLDGKCPVMRGFSASLSYPRPDSPHYPMAEPDARPGQASAASRGTVQTVARAGRPGCPANRRRRILARNPRGTIQSRWSRRLVLTVTARLGLAQPRTPSRVFGIAFVRG